MTHQARERIDKECFVQCSRCGKRVSNTVISSLPEDLVVRAWVECPECVEKQPSIPPLTLIGDERKRIGDYMADLKKHGHLNSLVFADLLARLQAGKSPTEDCEVNQPVVFWSETDGSIPNYEKPKRKAVRDAK